MDITSKGGYNVGMTSKPPRKPGRPQLSDDLPEGAHTQKHSLRVPAADWQAYQAAAAEEGLAVSSWMRRTLSRAAKRILRS